MRSVDCQTPSADKPCFASPFFSGRAATPSEEGLAYGSRILEELAGLPQRHAKLATFACIPYTPDTITVTMVPRNKVDVVVNGRPISPHDFTTLRADSRSSGRRRIEAEKGKVVFVKDVEIYNMRKGLIMVDKASKRKIAIPPVPTAYKVEVRFRKSARGREKHYCVFLSPGKRILRSLKEVEAEYGKRSFHSNPNCNINRLWATWMYWRYLSTLPLYMFRPNCESPATDMYV